MISHSFNRLYRRCAFAAFTGCATASLALAQPAAPTSLAESAGRDSGSSEVARQATAKEGLTPLTREQLLSSLSRDLAAHFNLEGEFQIELLRPWSAPDRVASLWQIEILEFPSVASSSMLLRCRVLADAAVVAETGFVLRASLWRDVWIARQPITVGAVFDPAVLDTRRVDLFRERDVLPAAVGDNSFIFARAINPGRPLTWRDIARRPLVKKGQMVEVSAADGLLVVSMKALAMENGAQGDTVTVRNPDSRKDFAATVIDENRVQVRF